MKARWCFSARGVPALWFAAQLMLSCATNPVTGKKEFSLLSESDEIRLGAEADRGIVAQYGLYDDPEVAEYVSDLGQRMAEISHRPHLEWHFRVLDSPVVNAFALPGGYIYMTRGILAYLNSEAELAGVMGHEIGHVTARHGAAAYTRAQLAQVGLTAGYVLSETFRRFGDIAETGIGLLFLSFSRSQESQSDELGVQYATALGYDAREMSRFFATLDRMAEKRGQALPSFLSTHPNPEDREVRTLRLAEAAQQDAGQKKFIKARERYLSKIEGLVFGEDPRQGFVEGGYFYHPTLDFQFPVPEKWEVVNTPQAVLMSNPEEDAAIQFSLATQKGAQAAAEAFVANSQAQVRRSHATRVHGFETVVVESQVTGKNQVLAVLSYFIEKGGRVFVFHGFTTPARYATYVQTFSHVMNQFDRLRSAAAKRKKPMRVKIVRVTKGGTLKQVLQRYGGVKISLKDLALINGMELTDTVRAGQQIKVLRAY